MSGGVPEVANLPNPLRLSDAIHCQVEWENAHQYAEGYAAGWAAAEQAIAEEITRAVGVKPYTAKGVIRWLIRGVGS